MPSAFSAFSLFLILIADEGRQVIPWIGRENTARHTLSLHALLLEQEHLIRGSISCQACLMDREITRHACVLAPRARYGAVSEVVIVSDVGLRGLSRKWVPGVEG